MTDVQGTLIELFARHPVAELESTMQYLVDAFRAPNFEAVKALQDYEEGYKRVRTAKRELERIVDRFRGDATGQALQCLNSLKELRLQTVYRSEKYKVLRELVAKTLYLNWPDNDQRAFDARVTIFDSWTDFFISYTNRDATATNNRYRTLISQS
jgi:hypothetical protein